MNSPAVVGERHFTLIKGGKEVRTFTVDPAQQMAAGAAFPSGKLLAYEDGAQWGNGIMNELYLLPDGRRATVMYFDNECRLSRESFGRWKIADQVLFDRVAPGPA